MQPLAVHCETCGAKLKVRDPRAVGQIHACPKCDSMVMVAMPAVGAELSQPPSSPSPTPVTTSAVNGLVAPSDFGDEVDQLLGPPSQASAPMEQPADFETKAVPDPVGNDEASESNAEELADITRTWTRNPMVWGVAGSVVCFALGALAAAWWVGTGDQQLAQSEVAAAEPGMPATKTLPPDVAPEEQAVEVNKPVVSAPAEEQSADESRDSRPAVKEQERVAALPDLPPVLEQDSSQVRSPRSKPPEPATSTTPPEMLQPLDPLAIDSANLDLLLVPNAATTALPPLGDTTSIEATDTEATHVGQLPQVATPPRKKRFEPGSASRGPSYAEQFGEGQLQERLSATVPAISWRNAPLHMALGELSQMALVPITLDPAALRMAGVAADHPINIDEQSTSVIDIASAAAADARLAVSATPNGLQIAKRGTDRWRERDYNVDDLCSEGEDAARIAKLVKQFVAPGTWLETEARLDVRGTKLAIHQETAVHYEVLLFCERLRKAQGLPTRSKYPTKLLAVEPRLAVLDKPLGRTTTFAVVDWTPLSSVFDHWQQSSGLTLLVDWQRLADIDLRPRATMAASVQNNSWRDALDACLTPLELAWVPVDGQTLWITTRDQAEQDCWIEFYRDVDAEAIREQIEGLADATTLAGFAVAEYSTGKLTIVRGNRQVHEALTP